MSFIDFQSKYTSVMESMLKSAVAETTKLFEAMVEELKAEISRIKKENDDLKTRCSQYEKAPLQTPDYGGGSGPGQPPCHSWEKRDRAVQCDLTSSCTEMVQNVEQQQSLRYCLHDHNYEYQEEAYYPIESSPFKGESALKNAEDEPICTGPHISNVYSTQDVFEVDEEDRVALVANDTQMAQSPEADLEHRQKQPSKKKTVPVEQLEGEQPSVLLQQCSGERSRTDQTVICQESVHFTRNQLGQPPTTRKEVIGEEQTTTRTCGTQMVYHHLVKPPEQKLISSSPFTAKHVVVTSDVSTGNANLDEAGTSKQGKTSESQILGNEAPSSRIPSVTDTFIYSSVKSQKPVVKSRQRCTSVTLQDAMLLVEAMSPNVSSSLPQSHTQLVDLRIPENVAIDPQATAPSTEAHEVEDISTSSKTVPAPNAAPQPRNSEINSDSKNSSEPLVHIKAYTAAEIPSTAQLNEQKNSPHPITLNSNVPTAKTNQSLLPKVFVTTHVSPTKVSSHSTPPSMRSAFGTTSLSRVPGKVTYITTRKLLPIVPPHNESRTSKDQVKLIIIQKKSKSIPRQSETISSERVGSELLSPPRLICLSGIQPDCENAKPVEVSPFSPFDTHYIPVDKINFNLNCGPQDSLCPKALELSVSVNSQDAPACGKKKTAEVSTKSAEMTNNVTGDNTTRLSSSSQNQSVSGDAQTAENTSTLSLNNMLVSLGLPETAATHSGLIASTESCKTKMSESTGSTTTFQLAVEPKLSPVVKLFRLPIWVNSQESISVSRLRMSGYPKPTFLPGNNTTHPHSDIARNFENSEEESHERSEVDICPTFKSSFDDHAYHLSKENGDVEEETPELGSIPSKHISYPQSRMTKAQFLAQLAVTPVEAGKKASTDASMDEKALDCETCSSDGKGSQKDSMMTRLRSHLRIHSQITRSETRLCTETTTTTASPKKTRLENANKENRTAVNGKSSEVEGVAFAEDPSLPTEIHEGHSKSDEPVTETSRHTRASSTTSQCSRFTSENNKPTSVDSKRLRKRLHHDTADIGCRKKVKPKLGSKIHSPKMSNSTSCPKTCCDSNTRLDESESSSLSFSKRTGGSPTKNVNEHVNGNVCPEEIKKTTKKPRQDISTHNKKTKAVNSKKSVKNKVLAKMTSSSQPKSAKAGKKCMSKAVWIPPIEEPAEEKTLLQVPVKKESKSGKVSTAFVSSFPANSVPFRLPPMVSPLQPLSVIGGRLLKNQCGECGRILSSPAALESHVSLHTGDRPFSCSVCGKRFPDSKSLKRHDRVHRNGRIHVCQECGKGFVYRFILSKHLQMVHSRIKRFVCPICTKGFFTRRDVEAHIRSHTGEKPFLCNLCGKKFNRRVELNVHLRWHYGEKRYWCSYCGKGFLDLNNLKRHTYIHTGEKPHACPHCSKHFTQSGHLKKHVKNVHKVH